MNASFQLGTALVSLAMLSLRPALADPAKDRLRTPLSSRGIGSTRPVTPRPPALAATNDPIRFTIQLRQASVNLGEDIELVITAELLDIAPASMFFTESANSFRLKLLMPEGFQQTAGTYTDYVGTTLAPATKPVVTYTVRGHFTAVAETAGFRLLRGSAVANDQSQFVEKAVLPVRAASSRLTTAQPTGALYVVTEQATLATTTRTTPVSSQSAASRAATGFVLTSVSPYLPVTSTADGATLGDALSPMLGVPVYGKNKAAIQNAVNAAPDGQRINLSGDYDFSADQNNPLVLNKNVELVGINACRFLGNTSNPNAVKIYGVSQRLILRNINFVATAPSGSVSVVYIDEEGDVQDVVFDNCEWSGPGANGSNYNAISTNQYNEFNGAAARIYKMTMVNPYIHDFGRMGIELLAHKWDRDNRITNVNIISPRIYRCGLYNPSGGGQNGMGISASGDVADVTISNADIQDCLLGLELIGVRNFAVSNPRIKSLRTYTVTENGKLATHGSVGISTTNGAGNVDGTSAARYPSGTVTGGNIVVSGRPLAGYNVGAVSFNSLDLIAGESIQFQHGVGTKFVGINVESTANKFIARFEDQKGLLVSGGVWSRQNATNSNALADADGNIGYYAPLDASGSSNSLFENVKILTNLSRNGGNSDNYYNDQQDYRNQTILASDPTVSLSNIWRNYVRQPDFVSQYIPTVNVTANGTYAALTHISRFTINPSAALSSVTLRLPTTTYDGKQVEIFFGGAMTSGTIVSGLSITEASGTAPIQVTAPTSAAAGLILRYQYNAVTGRYHRY